VKSRSKSRSDSDSEGKKKKKKGAKSKFDLPKIKPENVKKPSKVVRPASAKNLRPPKIIKVSESITKIDVLKSHAKGASRGVRNKLLENADTWSKVHCH
jgi:hypothetical protein